MTEAELQAIESRHREASPGPYRLEDGYEIWNAREELFATIYGTEVGQSISVGDEADASFLCHSWEDVLALVAEVRRLQAEKERRRDH